MHTHSTDPSTTPHSARMAMDAVVLSRLEISARNVPISGGLCLPRGRLFDVATILVEDRASAAVGQAQNCQVGCEPEPSQRATYGQAEVLNRWSDGSIRWMLASFVLHELPKANGRQLRLPLVITPCPTPPAPDVLTTVKHQQGQLLLRCRSDQEGCLQEHTLRICVNVSGTDGRTLPLQVDSILQQAQGPVRRVFVVQARLQHSPFITLVIRITHWVQADAFHVETRIRNSRRARHAGGLWDLGDAGSFLLRGLSLQIRSDDVGTCPHVLWKAEQDQPWRHCSASQQLRLTQYGSGGPFWSSDNHATATGDSPVVHRGYEVCSPDGVLRGYRAQPTVRLTSDDGGYVVAVPEFWQQFPGSISVLNGSTEIGLFPHDVQEVPYELQGGEQKTKSVWIQMLAGSASEDADPFRSDLAFALDRPTLVQPAADYQRADVFPWFPGEVSDPWAELPSAQFSDRYLGSMQYEDDVSRQLRYLQQALSGKHSLLARRDRIDEYGWRHFGDLPADHEQTHYPGSGTVVSHYNNQFDLIYGAILQLAGSGDLQWMDLLDPLARHVMDIDVYHTDQDRAAFNGGLFWHTDHYVHAATATHRTYSRRNQPADRSYGGGPGCEHNYTSGLLHYYFLTGHPEASDTVLSLAEWVIQMDDGRRTIYGLLDDGPTGCASATVDVNFHGPGRGAGNSINALLDAWILTASPRFLHKAEELIRRCVHPAQDLSALHLHDAEGHWSYTVFLTALSRYLLVRLEAGQKDAMYAYARGTMSHYGRWMLAHEIPTLSQPDKLQYPTEAWAAQDFRKANVLRLAAACEDDARTAAAMRSKARDLNNAAWAHLYAFGDARLTARCLAILMTEGQRDVFHRTCPPPTIPPATSRWQDDEQLCQPWQMFVPQQARVRQLLKSPTGILRASVHSLNPARWKRTFRALRRLLG